MNTPKNTSSRTRRQVLQAGFAWAAGSSLVSMVKANAPRSDEQPTWILLHLSGGNDGLNTVIPYRDPVYHELRPRLGRVAREALPIDQQVALHPSLPDLARLYRRGHVAILQGVGSAEPDYSHRGACRLWATNANDATSSPGWCDRALAGQSNAPAAIMVVADHEPPARMVSGRVPQIRLNRPNRPSPAVNPLPFRQGETQQVLAEAAGLASAKRPPRLILASVGGYDTHEDQLEAHAQVLRDLNDAVAGFHRELAARGIAHRVLLLVWSEFGRRPAENASGGTDHGWAGPVFLVGRNVRGGLYGRMPSLVDTDFGNLIPTVSLHKVQTTLARRWLGSEANPFV
ncbi:MAG TPA: DUF1501 domain-containing protein [Phycisphaerae bacterium]|jgi:uncharacterized protein (DUF1501 family)|nr:DUF1501 domain-containing protein [Phycisphaerae bacterium]HOB76134.1 DUF1501 domain-containing protein [Phycisphaerae bacterium]HOJ56007.1 DUF1501 domain-containing protein [Phycisphaerae bacterium]HOL25528.1 DUF1501 domain-containing protein [Phycisphaerae bacterium]HPP22279.1 DUF1501 domain-containing protein [Phycisphaerae bacterium]